MPLRTGEPRPPIVLTDPSIVIGSGSAAQIRLKSSSVSKAHAILLVEDGKAYARDLASRTQLYVNDAPVREAFLGEGDVVRVGRFGFGVHENTAAQARPHDPTAPTLRLRMGDTGTERVLAGRVILIGRRHGCDVIVPDHTVSGAHAVLFHLRGQWWLRDLGSREGTLVNGAEVRQQRALSAGDRLKLGAAKIVFLGAAVAGATDSGEPEEAGLAGATAAIAAAAAVSEPGAPLNVPAAATPAALALPETSSTPSEITECAAAMEVARAPLTPAPAEEPVVPPVPAEREVKKPPVFADAPIGRSLEETPPPTPAPLPPPPPVELPAHAEASPVAAPGENTWEARPVSGGERGDEPVAPVYRNGNSVDEEDGNSVDVDDGDSVDDDGEPRDDDSSGALETQPATEEEWDEAVTVWSFAELAQRGRERSSRDEVQVKPGGAASIAAAERRRWMWVTVGAAIACVAVLVTLLAHKLW